MGAVLIDTNGKVSRVWALREVQFRPAFPEFNEAIAAAVRQWVFEPPEVDGQTVPVCMAVTITVDWQ